MVRKSLQNLYTELTHKSRFCDKYSHKILILPLQQGGPTLAYAVPAHMIQEMTKYNSGIPQLTNLI